MLKDPIQIILADDDEDDRLFFEDAFKEITIETNVKFVNDGIELMDHLNKNGNQLPHILFLDLNMPGKNGIECLMEIKQMKQFDDVAIAIYSTSSSEQDIEETLVLGANVYIKKPNDFATLKSILEYVIKINWQYQTSGLNRANYLLSL
jgi:CheY-like chemotaxis protein